MKAIQTKSLGPTSIRGYRVKATCWLTSVTVAWDYSANAEENHEAAIEALICKLNNDRIISGKGGLWETVAVGESVDGKGKTAIIDLA